MSFHILAVDLVGKDKSIFKDEKLKVVTKEPHHELINELDPYIV
jgi:hypothetical protein